MLCSSVQLSMDDFTAYGGVYGNKEDSVFVNLEVRLHFVPCLNFHLKHLI